MKPLILILTSFLLLSLSNPLEPGNAVFFSPCDLEIDVTSSTLFVAGKTAREIRSFNIRELSPLHSYTTKLPPKALRVAGKHLLVACSHSEGELIVLNKSTLAHESTIVTGHGACDIALSPDLSRAYVCNQFSNDISVIDLHKRKETGRIPVLRQPMQLEISKDGRYLFAANFLPEGRADVDTVSSKVTLIDLYTEQPVKHISLANGSNALRGMCISADGKYILISHNLGRFQVPTSQLEQGWMNTSALSVIGVQSLELLASVLLDEPEFGAPGSWGVDCTEDFIYVAHSGTHDFSRIDYPAFIAKLQSHPAKESLAYDLHFLSGIRERIKVEGNGPRALKFSNNKLYVANYFSDNLSIIDQDNRTGSPVSQLKLSDGIWSDEARSDEARLGEIYFNDASYCFQSWQSCNGCHPNEARVDGLNWDLLNDGMGNPKSCKSMLLAHLTPPAMITGIRPDAEAAVKAGFEHIQFTSVSKEITSAVDSYLLSLEPVPSPHLVNGKLSRQAIKGKKVFERTGCANCHPAPYYTDLRQHEMGRQGTYDHQNTWDTPSLIEIWRTGPYLHDGRSATLQEVFTKEYHGIEQQLSDRDMEALVKYVLSL